MHLWLISFGMSRVTKEVQSKMAAINSNHYQPTLNEILIRLEYSIKKGNLKKNQLAYAHQY